jgi:hypothetical protein
MQAHLYGLTHQQREIVVAIYLPINLWDFVLSGEPEV